MKEYYNSDLGLTNSRDLALAYLDKLHDLQRHNPKLVPANAEELMDLNYHGELDDDALLNIEEVTSSDLADARPMSDWSQQLAHPFEGEADESLTSQSLALAAYEVSKLDQLSEEDQRNLLIATVQFLDEDTKDNATETLKQQYGFDDEILLTAQDLAHDVSNEYAAYHDELRRQFDESGVNLRTQNPTMGETEASRKLRHEFLENYRQGLTDELHDKQNDAFYETHVQDISVNEVDLTNKPYSYMLGRMMSQQLLQSIDAEENRRYHDRVEFNPDLSTEDSDQLLNETVANDVRDDPELRIMSDQDYQIMQRAVINDAEQHMSDALQHISDDDLQDVNNRDGVNVMNVASVMKDDSIKRMTFADANLISGLVPGGERRASYRMHNAYYNTFKADALPHELQRLVADFDKQNYDDLLASDLLNDDSKQQIVEEHHVNVKDDEPGLTLDDAMNASIDKETGENKMDKAEFLQQYVAGLQKSMEVDDLNQKLTTHDFQGLPLDNTPYMLGVFAGNDIDRQTLDYEDERFADWRMDHRHEWTDDAKKRMDSVSARDVRDREDLRVMSDDDYQIVQHASRNCLYHAVADSLNQIDNFDDLSTADQVKSMVNQLDDAKTSKLVKTTVDELDAQRVIDGSIYGVNNYDNYRRKMEAAKLMDNNSHYWELPNAIMTLVDNFGNADSRDFDAVLASSLISTNDKALLKQEHGLDEAQEPTFSVQEMLDAKQDPEKAAKLKRDYEASNTKSHELETSVAKGEKVSVNDPTVCDYQAFDDQQVADLLKKEWTMAGRPVMIHDDGQVTVEANDFRPYAGEISDATKEAFDDATLDTRNTVKTLVENLDDDTFKERQAAHNERYEKASVGMDACRSQLGEFESVSVPATTLVKNMIDYQQDVERDDQLNRHETKALLELGANMASDENNQNLDDANLVNSMYDQINQVEDDMHVGHDFDKQANSKDYQAMHTLAEGVIIGRDALDIDSRDREQYINHQIHNVDEFVFDGRNSSGWGDILNRAMDVESLTDKAIDQREDVNDELTMQDVFDMKQEAAHDETKASLLAGLDLNADVKVPDKVDSLQVTPEQAKTEIKEQTLQHDEDSHQEHIEVAKPKKKHKAKTNDGPEM